MTQLYSHIHILSILGRKESASYTIQLHNILLHATSQQQRYHGGEVLEEEEEEEEEYFG